MRRKSLESGPGAIDLLEEAVHLLRSAPAGLYGIYALGTLPFVLAFLYFWADMSRSAFAREHAGTGAVAMGLLFLWMKFWQAVFADMLRSRLAGHAAPPWTLRRAWQLALTQSALQPSGLFVVPLALLLLMPLAWVVSFYQNLTALGAEPDGLSETYRVAARQASTRPGQGWLLLGILSVFTLFVWLNLVVAMAWLPDLLKTLFGIDTAFTQAGWRSMLNTTYLASSFALTYVFVDPLTKAVFALRSFHGKSVQTGEDLKSELARVRTAISASLALPAALVFFFLATPVLAVSPDASPAEAHSATASVSTTELDRSIDEVLKRRDFAWRLPRDPAGDQPARRNGWFATTIGAVVDFLRDAVKYLFKNLGRAWDWIWEMIRKLFPSPKADDANPGDWHSGWRSALQTLLLILIVGIAAFLAVLIIRSWKRRRRIEGVVAEAITATPDLNEANVTANLLPEDAWLRLAREMMAQGNFRLALRALYLAGLAHLAAREMITLALFKSNRDYETELVRRSRALPEVQSAFSHNVAAFDRVWYGLHEVTPTGLEEFQSNLERIRAC